MKIIMKSDNQPLLVDPTEGSVHATPDSRLYIKLDQTYDKTPHRHGGELIFKDGWIHLDYDDMGFLMGIEIVQGDPITGVTECIPYLQPINPLVN